MLSHRVNSPLHYQCCFRSNISVPFLLQCFLVTGGIFLSFRGVFPTKSPELLHACLALVFSCRCHGMVAIHVNGRGGRGMPSHMTAVASQEAVGKTKPV